MNNKKCFSILLLLTIVCLTAPKEINIILSLQKLFSSRLVLVLTEQNDSFSKNIVYDLIKRQEINFFIGNGLESDEMDSFKIKSYIGFNKPLIVSFNCKYLINLLQNIESYKLKNLIWIHFINRSEEVKELQSVYIPYDCQFIIIKKISYDYQLVELYKLREKFEMIQLNFGNYDNGLSHSDLSFYDRRMNLNGLNFSLALSIFEFSFVRQNRAVWSMLQQKMNFSWRELNSEPFAGGFLQNGTTTGMFKFIEERKADGTIGHFVVSSERIKKYDFVFPTRNAEVKIFLTLSYKFKWTSYIGPFSLNLWIVIVSWAAFASVCLFIINLSIRNYFKEETPGSFVIVIKILCYQGANLSSSRLSLLISWLMPYIIAILITQVYSGSLQSHLTIKEYTPPFQSLQGLIQNGGYKIATISSQFVWFFFLSDTSKEITIVREKYLLPYEMQPKDYDEAFSQLCASEVHLAFVAIIPLTAAVRCKVVELQTSLFRMPIGMMFVKNFPFTDVMNLQLQRIRGAGLILKSFQDNEIEEILSSNEDVTPLSLDSVLPLFYILMIALILGLVIFFIEILIAHRAMKRKKQQFFRRQRKIRMYPSWDFESNATTTYKAFNHLNFLYE